MDPTPANLQSLFVAFNVKFNEGFSSVTPWWQRIATRVPSLTSKEVHAWLDLIPEMREWVGERVVHFLSVRSQEIVNRDFELTVGINANTIKDDQYGLFGPKLVGFGRAAANFPNRLVIDAVKKALTAVVYDGQFFFDTDHPLDPDSPGVGTPMSNKITTALSQTSFRAAATAMQGFTGSNGQALGIEPDLLVVPPALKYTAREIVKAELLERNGAGITNVVTSDNVDVLVIPEMAEISSTAWMLLDTKKPVKPFLFQDRETPTPAYKTERTDENVFWFNQFIYGLNGRGAGGYGMWQTAYYSTGTT